MTPRPLARTRRAYAALLFGLALGLTALAGCDPRQMLYFLQPFEPRIAAPGPSLKGKRVVVITRMAATVNNDFIALDQELNKQVCSILRENVRRIDLVDPGDVQRWSQNHPSWTNPADVGFAFEADLVISFEVSRFQIEDPKSPDSYEGQSSVSVRVTELAHPKDSHGREMMDKPKEASTVFEDDHDTTFPIRGPLPASADVSRTAFKNKFVKLVATELSWYFVAHAHGDNIQDVKFRGD